MRLAAPTLAQPVADQLPYLSIEVEMTVPGPQHQKRTVLHPAHLRIGARMIGFAGWEMPVSYAGGILAEVRAVRTAAGMFDVSHMGRLRITGPRAVSFLDTVLSADVAGLKSGRSRYHLICDEEGGIIDDAIVYRLGDDQCLLVVNASNTDAVIQWFEPRIEAHGGAELFNYTDQIAMIAVQGPEAASVLDRLCPLPASSIRPFRVAEATLDGMQMRIARTGYTGEDGFELMPPRQAAVQTWDLLRDAGVEPCGLGARDVLRLEAGYRLHGSDMARSNNPYEAGLGRFVHLDSPGYVAADALRQIKASGTDRVVTGFRMVGRGIPRHGQAILKDGAVIGTVTSGTHSPTLDANIGLGYVDRRFATPTTRFDIDVRGRSVEAEVTPLPFYSKGR